MRDENRHERNQSRSDAGERQTKREALFGDADNESAKGG